MTSLTTSYITEREYFAHSSSPAWTKHNDRVGRLPSYYADLKSYHMDHHYKDAENGFGVTSRFWDRVFGTELHPKKIPNRGKAA